MASNTNSDESEANMYEIQQQFQNLQTKATNVQQQFETNKQMTASLLSNNNEPNTASSSSSNTDQPITNNDDDEKKSTASDSRRQRRSSPPPNDPQITNNTTKPPKSTTLFSKKRHDFNSMSAIIRRELLDACDKMNYTHPSKIQAEAIPRCLQPNYPNLIGQAHHGSGKTAAFTLIMLQRINETIDKLQGLVVVHSRELAIQIHSVCTSLGTFITDLRICCAIKGGDPPIPWRHQVCIGTPGTIIDKVFHRQTRVKGGLPQFLSDFKILIIDEADEFMHSDLKTKYKYRTNDTNSSFGTLFDQLKMITTDLKENATSFQTLLFSATYPATIKRYAIQIAPKATIIKIKQKEVKLPNVRVFSVQCTDDEDKFQTLLNLISLSNCGQMIIFANSVWKAQQLIDGLMSEQVGIPCSALYGRGMDIFVRDKTMEEFRNNQTQCLVASNVIARGIDVPAVGMVVNFDIPVTQGHSTVTGVTGFTFDSETFMHRVGRTGRFGAKGVCINLIGSSDSIDNDHLTAIQKEYSLDIQALDKSAKAIKESITMWLHDQNYD